MSTHSKPSYIKTNNTYKSHSKNVRKLHLPAPVRRELLFHVKIFQQAACELDQLFLFLNRTVALFKKKKLLRDSQPSSRLRRRLGKFKLLIKKWKKLLEKVFTPSERLLWISLTNLITRSDQRQDFTAA